MLAARLGVLMILGGASCVNLTYPPGAGRDGGAFVSHLATGVPCALNTDCTTGFCVDSVCCAELCEGPCATCAKEGSAGVCLRAEEGTDPRNKCEDMGAASCGQNGTCDREGKCAKYSPGTVCKDATCVADLAFLASRCNSMGACEAGAMKECSPYVCGSDGNCLTQCTELRHCENPHPCVAGLCGKKALGTACGDAAECDSGFCAQGVCCGKDCAGTCMSCALKGSEGVCTAVPAGMLPPSAKPCAVADVSTCGADGTCDGAGACRLFPSGTTCMPASCSTASQRSAGTCDGKMHCQMAATVTCGGYTCATAVACRTSCLSDAECASPSVCGRMSCGGLSAQYFKQTNLTEPAFSRTDASIDFDWGLGAPSPQVNTDSFSVRWRGKLTARFSEPYRFFAGTDDGERLWVDGRLIIDRYTQHSSVPEDMGSEIISLTAGRPVDIQMEYFESGGNASVRLLWQSRDEPKAVIPTSALAPQ